ncbi:hypothetical protein POM88_011771 [Heracleum sosnowskyi]|uniref:Purple acid phosphatase n=1 Tax=Heracleum sosnowskyi TaxID=360622 RepID=A0AAD8MWS9_9APIA|nr:hypothetical protein POM88_011771 [Heracleum sosnowskyi]
MIMLNDRRMEFLLLQVLIVCYGFLSFAECRTSSFVRSEWPSVDIPLDNEVFALPKGNNAPQQVHITQGDYDGKAVIISWVTPDEPGTSQVRYGTTEKKYDFVAEGKFKNYTFYNYTSGYIHHCLVDNLEYNTKYYYEIGNGHSARQFWFQTPPKIGPDVPYKFGIIGDLGQTYNSLSTVEHYMQSGGQAILFVGDLSYADRYEYHDVGVRWDSWGRFVERIAAYQPWMWSAGNHEIEYMPHMGEVTPFKSYLHRYPTPYLASDSSSPLWYAVRRASAHIIVLSSYSPFGDPHTSEIWRLETYYEMLVIILSCGPIGCYDGAAENHYRLSSGHMITLSLNGFNTSWKKRLTSSRKNALLDTRFEQLSDPHICNNLKVQLQIVGEPQVAGTYIATLHYQMAYRVENHSFDLSLPRDTDEALFLEIDVQSNSSCIHLPKQIPKDELVKLLPESWVTHYEKIRRDNQPIHSVKSSFFRKKDGAVKIVFKKDDSSSSSDTSIFSSEVNMFEENIHIHSFDSNGKPIYAFSQDGHIFWSVCNCEACLKDQWSDDDDYPSRRRGKNKKSMQKILQERYEKGDSEVGLLGLSSTGI